MSKVTASESKIADVLAAWAQRFEPVLAALPAAGAEVPAVLAEAMRYSLCGGGKRIRPYIVTRICELCGGTSAQAAPAAAAVECVHTFSLIHDDLPALDDDDFRRGRPSCHKAFGEAVAILAGDALLTLAFEILATRIREPAAAAAAAAELARSCGGAGMIGGQVRDLLGEREPVTPARLEEIHRAKTGRLFEGAARLGAICAGADGPRNQAAAAFGRHLGLAFQIADDLLDYTQDERTSAKPTYPAAVGAAAARRAAQAAAGQAIEALDIFGPAADDLRGLAHFVVERNK